MCVCEFVVVVVVIVIFVFNVMHFEKTIENVFCSRQKTVSLFYGPVRNLLKANNELYWDDWIRILYIKAVVCVIFPPLSGLRNNMCIHDITYR